MFDFRHLCSILDTSVRSETLVFDFGHQCSILDTVVRFKTLTFLDTSV